MERFSKSFSRKVNKVLMNYGDKYIKGEINKKEFSRLCNLSYPTIYKYLKILDYK